MSPTLCRHRWRPMPPLPAKVCLACGAIASWRPLPVDSPKDVGPADAARVDEAGTRGGADR